MRTLRTVGELRAALGESHRAGARVGLVPTMGALHAGHRALIERAVAECDLVVVSLFVNPTQFRPGEDLGSYPRDEGADAVVAAEAGTDILFAPAVDEVYPAGFATTVAVAGVTAPLEGVTRGPEHFAGVTTVVAKLLNMTGAGAAYFGQKDAQQAAAIRRMARDLDLPVAIEVAPTVRELDGLALSSRNAYLAADERARAVALPRALAAVEAAVAAGERDAGAALAAGRIAMASYAVEPEYLAIVDPESFRPVDAIDAPALVAVAARLGRARLIDNTFVDVRAPASAQDGRS